MKERVDFSQAPHGYSICLNRECPQADTCLRQLVEQSIPADIQHWIIISPKYLAVLKGDCPHYQPDTKIRFAKGFINMLDNLSHKQMKSVINHLISHFGRRSYYRFRKGERLLSPTEQQHFLNILRNCDVSQPLEFDTYIEEYEW